MVAAAPPVVDSPAGPARAPGSKAPRKSPAKAATKAPPASIAVPAQDAAGTVQAHAQPGTPVSAPAPLPTPARLRALAGGLAGKFAHPLHALRRVPARPARWAIAGSPFFTVALAGSVLIHLIALSIHFQPELKRMLDRGPTLEVALVNAKTKDRPAKADILAQANLDGGGNTDADRRARTPLPLMPQSKVNAELAMAPQQIEELEQKTQELLTQLRSVPIVAPPAPKPSEAAEPPDLPSTAELTQRAFESMRLEAQVAKEFEAYQKRPKRRFIGARAEEYRFARYVEDWRLKVERIGNLNYPEAARELKLYGNLILSVAIRADGSLESVDVHRSSGQRILDAAAVRIVEMGAPYAPLPANIRRDTDVLVITRTWSFSKGDELRSD